MVKIDIKKNKIHQSVAVFSLFLIIFASYSHLYFRFSELTVAKYEGKVLQSEQVNAIDLPLKKEFIATHIKTPAPLKAIYMTGWVAGSTARRNELVKIIDETEVNAVVIDIKDYTGKISFEVFDPALLKVHPFEKRILDIREFIKTLHDKNIYVIGRVSVFQDPNLVKARPDLAVKKMSNKTEVWKDYKGISWLDAGASEVWDYIEAIGKESYADGFDEINLDYVRFPSDGNMKDIYFPFSDGGVKSDILKTFFQHMHSRFTGTGIVLSADIFGMTTTNKDDLNIGQLLENILPYVDYVAPMVYPSHYPKGFIGLQNPAEHPYEVIKYSMDHAVARAKTASTSPEKIRPWLQDFNLGAIYTPEMVRKQIEATYDSGLTSWMLWNASNRYTVPALLKE